MDGIEKKPRQGGPGQAESGKHQETTFIIPQNANIDKFLAAIRSNGLNPPTTIQPGDFVRFPGEGKRNCNQAGYAKLFADGLGGIFGDWSTGLQGTWQAERPRNPEAYRRQRDAIRKAQEEAQRIRQEEQTAAAGKARELWDRSFPADDEHPYLKKKNVKSHGLKIDGADLLVPIYDGVELISIQSITPDGSKYFLKNSRTGGGYHIIGEITDRLIIVEGFGTGSTIHESTGSPVVVAFNAGNLLPVARKIREQYPNAEIMIAADDDAKTAGNPGLTKAREAARSINARLAIPDFGDNRPDDATDFNDLVQHRGPDEVRLQVEAAEEPEDKTTADEMLYTHFFAAPSHGLAADILYDALSTSVIYEPHNNKTGVFYIRESGECYYSEARNMKNRARAILERAIGVAFEIEKAESDDIKGVFQQAGKAYQKARTRDFLASTLQLFAERVTVQNVPWNVAPECVVTKTGIIDFTTEQITVRDARPEEYYRDPLPIAAEAVMHGGGCSSFEQFMTDLFPDPENKQSALHCAAMCVANKSSKIFQIWNNREGNGGKNSLADVIGLVLGARAVNASGALILYKPDQSERRFGGAALQGATAAFFDEVGGTFDIAGIKRLSALSKIRVEQKGRDSFEILPTWALVAMCNDLPAFFPSDDLGFLSRLFVLPFDTVFYAGEEEKVRYLKHGVAEYRLKPARDREEIFTEIRPERAAILYKLIIEYVDLRQYNNGRPYESPNCRRAKDAYRSENDITEKFFDEYLTADETGRVEYSRLIELYHEYTGSRKMTTRKLVAELKRRFHFIDTQAAHGKRYIRGVSERFEKGFGL